MKNSLYPSMSKGQYLFGLCYIVAQQFLLPRALVAVILWLGLPISSLWLNFAFFTLNLAVILTVFGSYLVRQLRRFTEDPLPALSICVQGFVLYWVANTAFSMLINGLLPDFSNVNDANIAAMAANRYWVMFTGSVILVPIVEETLYRGVVFGLGDRLSRPAAYILSTLLFSLIHVVGYMGALSPLRLGVSLLQYVPAGLCLSWAYAKSRTIFVPTLIHTAVNLLGMLEMR